MVKFFSRWGKPSADPVLLPAPVHDMGLQAHPLLINLPAGSPQRTLRCLHRMVRLHRTLANPKRSDEFKVSFQEELVRKQTLLLLSGDTGPVDVESLEERIEILEAK